MKHTSYTPLTATPFRRDNLYREILPTNSMLSRYVRCFWGSDHPCLDVENRSIIVIPDTCVDIIYQIDHTDQTVTGGFCGINDASFTDHADTAVGHLVSVFAIRFYAWSACSFSEDSLKDTANGYCDVQSRFRWLDLLLRRRLPELRSLNERSRLAESLLLCRMEQRRQNDVVALAVHQILRRQGVLSAAGLAEECFISGRQLERLFHEYIGITPKKLCNLVRYQYLWNEIVRNPAFDVQDAVLKYGYTDQAHLMREFRRYHTMDIRSARLLALGLIPADIQTERVPSPLPPAKI